MSRAGAAPVAFRPYAGSPRADHGARSARASREREDRYDVDLEFTLPDVTVVSPAVERIAEQDRLALQSTYYDTAELDLLRHGVTLRRLRGPVDAGWQLKLPDRDARMELAVAEATGAMPPQLRDVVAGIRLGRPLKRVVELRISRGVQRLLTEDGQVLATVSDDVVHAHTLTGESERTDWREIEVELGPAGDEALLAAIGEHLIGAGAAPSAVRSKFEHALGIKAATRAKAATAGAVVVGYLSRQYSALLLGDIALRAGYDSADAVEATGTATRRLRNARRVFTDFFDADRARELDAELAWLASLLDEVRDTIRLRARLSAAVADLADELVVGDPARRIDAHLRAQQELHQQALFGALRGRRYRALLQDLNSWTTAPPLHDAADESPDGVADRLDAAERVVLKRLRRAAAPKGTDADLRRAHRAAERARDAVDVSRPVLRKKRVKAKISRYTAVQELLGEYEDALAAAEVSRRLGTGRGGNGFSLGVLHEHERQRAGRARRLVAGETSALAKALD
jgi:inorganic triphosphatase YgiF